MLTVAPSPKPRRARRAPASEGPVFEIHRLLTRTYGTPDLGNVEEVFGELVFALLSTRTAPGNYRRAFATLRRRFPDWRRLAATPEGDLQSILRSCGLHRRKARALIAIARRIFVKEGCADLEHLRDMSTEQAEAILTSLPDVGVKVAKCVCLYALRRPVFPLDAHNLRVLKRLRLVEPSTDARRDARRVEDLIPPQLRHELHVNLIAHGRAVCTTSPACPACVLRALCPEAARNGRRRAC